ncbi:hypothetical protein ACWDOG_26225, partial [Streptomyces fungicidicus]
MARRLLTLLADLRAVVLTEQRLPAVEAEPALAAAPHPIPAALGQLWLWGHPAAGTGAGPGSVVPRTWAAVSPPRAGTPGGVGPGTPGRRP